MSYEIISEENGLVIAGNGVDFIRCSSYSDGTFHRRTGPATSVESRDLDYMAIGATKYATAEAASE